MTVTSTRPAEAAGVVAVRVVPLATLTDVAAAEPKSTVVEPVMKPVPVIVTLVPPTRGPAPGETAVTVGTGS
jgi:hypothetical protein